MILDDTIYIINILDMHETFNTKAKANSAYVIRRDYLKTKRNERKYVQIS